MTIEPCTCSPVLVRSSRQDEDGCQLVDGVDEEGNRWHGYRLTGDEGPHWLTVVAPGPSLLAERAKSGEELVPARAEAEAVAARRAELKAGAAEGTLTAAEVQELLALL